jgi:DNA repair protein RadD
MSLIDLRPYQRAAIDAVYDYWSRGGGNPLVDLATGLGKSVVIASIVERVLTDYPDMRVLMLVHSRELVEQNALALLRLWPQAPVGIYSAGLGRRDAHHRITFASIQSVFRRARELGPRDLVLIDEAHLIPVEGNGMYRTLLDGLRDLRADMRVAGFTATPYRMGTGRLDEAAVKRKDGKERVLPALFDETVFSYGIGPGIDDGWLSPLVSKAGATEIDVSSVARSGGEFVAGALEAAANRDDVTAAAVQDMMARGQDRRSWLVFCTGVKHAFAVRDVLRQQGISAEAITGETPGPERASIIAAFKAGRIRALTNAQVLTTGFDAPGVDLVAMLRPTLSTGLYVQIVGRGTRKAEGKENCLVLDFAGNVRRHGPVDTVEVRGRRGGSGTAATVDRVMAKECPTCNSLNALNAGICKDCGHVWPVIEKPKHEARADDAPILSRQAKALIAVDEQPVVSWSAIRHVKDGSPDSVKVVYLAGLMTYPEWVTFEHTGPSRYRAEKWWKTHGGAEPVPATVSEALLRWDELHQPVAIQTRKNGKWFDIVGRSFRPREQAA